LLKILPFCQESIEWYLIEVYGYLSDEEIIDASGVLEFSDVSPNSKVVGRIKSAIDSEQIRKLHKYHQGTGKCYAVFIPSSRDSFCESKRMSQVLQGYEIMKGKEV